MNSMPVEFDMLREFIKTFKASLDPRLWFKLVEEETRELQEAIFDKKHRAEILKELTDCRYVIAGYVLTAQGAAEGDLMCLEEIQDMYRLFDECSKLIEETEEKFTQEVVDEAFKRVHNSNLSKLGDDGKPIFREDGKVLKGPNYKKPDLSDLI